MHNNSCDSRRMTICKDFLGTARFYEWFKNGRLIKMDKEDDEIFFHIEKLDGERKHGAMKVTKHMKEIFDTLFQGPNELQNVNFIEWGDGTYAVVFSDGVHISSKICKMNKKEFESWERCVAQG